MIRGVLLVTLLAVSCGTDALPDIEGTWFRCAGGDCNPPAQDGFELADDGEFVVLRATGDGAYCESAFGRYDRDGDSLHIMPRDAFAEELTERTVRFRVKKDRATLSEAGRPDMEYRRIVAANEGPCPGVNTDL